PGAGQHAHLGSGAAARRRPGRALLGSRPMPASGTFATKLNEQIANEFAAHQQYVACAVYYEAETLPQLAAFFYRQALEERGHAMMMIQYLLDTGADVVTPGITAPRISFDDVTEPIALAL